MQLQDADYCTSARVIAHRVVQAKPSESDKTAFHFFPIFRILINWYDIVWSLLYNPHVWVVAINKAFAWHFLII